jgi:hypothetical protein
MATNVGRDPASPLTQLYDMRDHEKHPNSYGLIRKHTDFQPRSTRDWTVEFLLTLGEKERLVTTPEDRRTVNVYGASTQPVRYIEGVFVFDQTLMASYCDFHDGVATRNLRYPTLAGAPTSANIEPTDTLALSALAVCFSSTELLATCTLIDNTTRVYYPYKVKLSHAITYTEGDDYHVAVRYTSSTRLLEFIIDGAAASGGSGSSTYTLLADERFAGEQDEINNTSTTYWRDIVLLNECTVRGMYASTCKLSHMATGCSKFTQDRHQKLSGPYSQPPSHVPFCSPPRGTGMAELRIWFEARSNGDLSTNARTQLLPAFSANLKGYWRLDDGFGTLIEQIGEKHGSVHNTYPQYIADKGLLHNQGIRFSDNQFMQLHLDDTAYTSDAYPYLQRMLQGRAPTLLDGLPDDEYWNEAVCDWTFQVQLTTEYDAQYELNELGLSGWPHEQDWRTSAELRDMPGDGTVFGTTVRMQAYELRDGQSTPIPIVDDQGQGKRGTTDVSIFHPAFDQTIFSVEGQEEPDSADTDNHYERRRVPLIRGLLAPDNRVVLEYFCDGDGTTDPTPRYAQGIHVGRYLRLKSTTALSDSTTYTLTFIKRTLWEKNKAPNVFPVGVGYQLEIWINGSLDNSYKQINNSFMPATDTVTDDQALSRACYHFPVYDINIGASYVGDIVDRSETPPIQQTVGPAPPFYHGAHRNRCYQDQPGFFTMGFFRVWGSKALSSAEVASTWSSSISRDNSPDDSLLVNLEIDTIAPSVISKSRFTAVFDLNYKSWHVPSGNGDDLFWTWEEYSWINEDCLGYNNVPSDFVPAVSLHAPCNLLGLYSAVIAKTFGLFSIFGEAPFFDNSLSGAKQNIYCPVAGLLNEFISGQKWESTVIAERMILTAPGAIPKVFDGKAIYTLGFTMYRGPGAIRLSISNTGGSLTASKYYGVRLVYFSEEDAIIDVTPVAVVRTSAGVTDRLEFADIVAHPDPRVTSIRIYRSVAQDSLADAELAPLFLTSGGALQNRHIPQEFEGAADSDLLDVVLDLNVTTPPTGSISGALDGVLWIGGDPLLGDAIYPADPGNPQRFDIVGGQLVIEEDSSENVVALFPIFGDLYVCKPTSIHRLTPQGNNLYSVLKIVGVGPVSSRAIEAIVLPQDGRTVLAFWSKFGPYIFDGSREQYLGESIEVDRAGGEPYDWLDADSVFILHDPTHREIQFRYKSVSGGSAVDRHDKAIIYNYRLNTWYHYGQTIGDYALFANIANDATIAAIAAQTPTTGEVPLTPTRANRLIVGGPNGHLYEWGTDTRDGERTEVTTNPGTVLSWSSPTITLTASIFSASDVARGSWITVEKADGSDYFSLPASTNTGNTLTLDLGYGSVGFAPANGDTVYIGQPPALLEFPWDIMDIPGINKSVQHLFLWFDKDLYYRFALDWDASNNTGWVNLTDAAGKRFHDILMNQDGEAHKLYLRSHELSSRIDQVLYIVEDKAGPGIHQ